MIRTFLNARIISKSLFSNRVYMNYSRVRHITSIKSRFYSSEIIHNKEESNVRELIAAQDSDAFGTLSIDVAPPDDELIDEGDIKEEEYLKNPPSLSQKLSTKQYADMIKSHLKYNRIKEAVDVLEVRMLKEDRVKPENYIYNLLIDGCAKVGYSKKAFNLFLRMRQRGLKVTGATYTSLFNACAMTPWKEVGLEKAKGLREIMFEKGFEPNVSNYNAMIKAFGRCQDLPTAFSIVDEMTEKKMRIDVDTFNFLLQACASDAEYGFRHALLVWHKMLRRKLNPDIYTFNLILRCCRDTLFGDVESMEEVLQTILLNDSSEESKHLKLEANYSSNQLEVENKSENSQSTFDPIPNLLAPKPHLGNLVSLKNVTKPEDKFLLLGGFSGFIETMKYYNVKPTLITYTQLVEVIPSTTAAEKRVMAHIKKYETKCDVDFFNILMKKRSVRGDYQGAKEVFEMIEKVKLKPDIATYGVLALGCQSREEANILIQEMDANGYKMNIQILGAMLKTACIKKNFDYVIDVLDIIKDLNLKPSERIIDCLDALIKVCNKFRKKDWTVASKEFRKDFGTFKQKLEKWKVDVGLRDLELSEAKKILKDAPWEQFQSVQADGFEDVKSLKQQKMQKYKRFIGKIKNLKVEE
ncbi:CLUMA_CG020011, isoform A [Clunio marinus]|uniref:CLUMA_CG020011, isoform A n=1 Tax=Clunio marinus TaxID=568069 RepID=A0A1J1J4U0_9DIPT|nr:CLUMA_CG020011, isoform A [Clunio marinus]